MNLKLSESVSVSLIYDESKNAVFPNFISWKGRKHRILKVGLHHTLRRGRTLYHVFSVISDSLFFRIVLDTDTLHWKVEEISDGMAS